MAITVPTATPKELQSWSIGRESVSGTTVNPTMNVPLNSGTPEDRLTLLADHDLRGDMGLDYNLIAGTEIGSFSMNGDVYLDSIGHLLYNTFGDYNATLTTAGTAMTGATVTTVSQVGTTSVWTITGTGFSTSATTGSYVQISSTFTGSAGTTTASEVVQLLATATATSLSVGTQPRFAYGVTGSTVSVSYTLASAKPAVTHTFALQNTYNAAQLGLPRTAQPVTHTITHYNSLPGRAGIGPQGASYSGYRQYGYWCSAGQDFTLNNNNLFQHTTHGTSFMGVDLNTSPAASIALGGIGTAPPAQASWQFACGVGGAALTTAGATTSNLLQNVEQAAVSIARTLTPKYALVGQQTPVIIGRQDLSITGTLQFIADDESPLYAYLNQQLGLLNVPSVSTATSLYLNMVLPSTASAQNPTGSPLGLTFQMSNVRFETATLQDPDMMQYSVSFRGLMNTTDVGATGGRGPGIVTLINNVPTY